MLSPSMDTVTDGRPVSTHHSMLETFSVEKQDLPSGLSSTFTFLHQRLLTFSFSNFRSGSSALNLGGPRNKNNSNDNNSIPAVAASKAAAADSHTEDFEDSIPQATVQVKPSGAVQTAASESSSSLAASASSNPGNPGQPVKLNSTRHILHKRRGRKPKYLKELQAMELEKSLRAPASAAATEGGGRGGAPNDPSEKILKRKRIG